MRWFGIGGIALCVGLAGAEKSAWAQAVAPSGATQTSASVASDGHVTVEIAPKTATGTSLNQYSDFNVTSAGVDLNNQAVQARTIINEVTSANTTSITGPLTVLGPAANLIIANPNGITVNGGSFRNTGSAALATGGVGFDAKQNIVLTPSIGGLTIGADGLASSLAELDLISKQIKVGGALANTSADPNAKLRLIAGSPRTTLNAKHPVTSTIDGWSSTDAPAGATSSSLSVDVSSAGSLKAGSINLLVNDAGAGVRLMGDSVAGVGGFTLSSNGAVEITDAQISAPKAVEISGSTVGLTSNTRVASITSDASGVLIEATSGDLKILGGTIKGKQRIFTTFSSNGGVTLSATGQILAAASAGYKPTLWSTSEALAVFAGGPLSLTDATLTSAQDIRLSADGLATLKTTTATAAQDLRIVSTEATSVTESALKADGDIHLDASELTFTSGATQTEVIASGGVVLRTTAGGVTNSGALIEGFATSTRDPDAKGAVTVLSAGDVTNTSLTPTSLAIFFGRSGDLYIDAGGNVSNNTGRLFSNQNIVIAASGTFSNQTEMSGDGELRRTLAASAPTWRTLWLFPERSARLAGDFGSSRIANEFGLVTGVGNVTITADRLVNKAGQISGDNVTLTGTHGLSIESLRSGRVDFEQQCGLFSCSVSGSSNTALMAAAVNAGAKLTLKSDVRIDNIAGRLIGGTGVETASPKFVSTSLHLPTIVLRPQGLLGGFQGHYGWVGFNFDGGFIDATKGDLTVHSTDPADVSGTELLAPSGVVLIDKPGDIVARPNAESFALNPIGLFSPVLAQ
jgi:filamentous hemagglutinin family protein